MKFADHLADPKTPISVRAFLQAALAERRPTELPQLFATTTRAFSGRDASGAVVKLKAGDRVRVTDAGRFGDVGITQMLDEPKLYQARAVLAELTGFSSWPGAPS
jgi:hypothetical protein